MRINQALLLIGLGLTVSLSSCHDPKEGKDGVSPEENAPATTPYIMPNIPTSLPALPELPADNPLTVEGVELGRHLFYETKLSSSNTISCGSCHQQQFAFADNLAISPGVEGTLGTRNAMSLTNVIWETSLNWDGSSTTLEDQARTPLQAHFEMNQPLTVAAQKLQETTIYPDMVWKAFGTHTIKPEHITKALAQFQRTLISGNSKFDKSKTGSERLSFDEMMGQKLFNGHTTFNSSGAVIIQGGECFHCHGSNGTSSSKEFFNNGLKESFTDKGRGGFTSKTSENGFFKAPSLRNIELTAPYMHDGSVATLEEVLDHYSEHVKRNSPNLDINLFKFPELSPGETGVNLNETQKRQIIAFLKTLTDTTFVNDKRFSNPFNQ